VIGGVAWPDIVIVVVLVLATLKGYSRGFVAELGGAVAVTAALITPWFYNGSLDAPIMQWPTSSACSLPAWERTSRS
jgi:uncharacterized membrane protein required for colicin V production